MLELKSEREAVEYKLINIKLAGKYTKRVPGKRQNWKRYTGKYKNYKQFNVPNKEDGRGLRQIENRYKIFIVRMASYFANNQEVLENHVDMLTKILNAPEFL